MASVTGRRGVSNQAFGTAPLSAGDWALCTVMASAVLWADVLDLTDPGEVTPAAIQHQVGAGA